MNEFAQKIRAMSYVERWHYYANNKGENIAEHSWWVAFYVMWLMEVSALTELTRSTQLEVLQSAMLHDIAESVTADLPFLVKRAVGKKAWEGVETQALAELTRSLPASLAVKWQTLATASVPVVKAADLLDVVRFAQEQAFLGNRMYERIEKESVGLLRGMVDKPLCDGIPAILSAMNEDGPGVEVTAHMTHFGGDNEPQTGGRI